MRTVVLFVMGSVPVVVTLTADEEVDPLDAGLKK